MDTGRRFVNELSDQAVRANAILALEKPALALADQPAVDKVGGDLSQALAKGVVGRFDTLAQLADHYGVNRSVLENSVSRYNECQKQQQDSDFGKPILADSRPIAVPPFYNALEIFCVPDCQAFEKPNNVPNNPNSMGFPRRLSRLRN